MMSDGAPPLPPAADGFSPADRAKIRAAEIMARASVEGAKYLALGLALVALAIYGHGHLLRFGAPPLLDLALERVGGALTALRVAVDRAPQLLKQAAGGVAGAAALALVVRSRTPLAHLGGGLWSPYFCLISFGARSRRCSLRT